MSSFPEPLIVEVLSKNRGGIGLFRLTEAYTFDLTRIGFEGTVTVPKDYVTDFASVPRPFRWLLPISGKVAKPALLHDQMCRFNDRSATKVFNAALKDAGVFVLIRWMMVAFVFIFKFPDLYL